MTLNRLGRGGSEPLCAAPFAPYVKCGSDKKPIACPAIPTLQLCWLATNGTQESKIFRRFLRKIF